MASKFARLKLLRSPTCDRAQNRACAQSAERCLQWAAMRCAAKKTHTHNTQSRNQKGAQGRTFHRRLPESLCAMRRQPKEPERGARQKMSFLRRTAKGTAALQDCCEEGKGRKRGKEEKKGRWGESEREGR